MFFGIGYLFHCALYAWKHSFKSDSCDNDKLGISYNALSIFIHSVSLFILPSFMKEIMTTVLGKIYVPSEFCLLTRAFG